MKKFNNSIEIECFLIHTESFVADSIVSTQDKTQGNYKTKIYLIEMNIINIYIWNKEYTKKASLQKGPYGNLQVIHQQYHSLNQQKVQLVSNKFQVQFDLSESK